MSQEKKEKMFGCDPDEFLTDIEGPIERSGLAMVLMSMLSDVQEMIARSRDEDARQALNRVKLVIDRKLRDKVEAPELKPIPAEDLACLMMAEAFLLEEASGFLNSDDGTGYWATATHRSGIPVHAARPDWATHVLWFNK